MVPERDGPLTRAQQEWLNWVPLNSPGSYADNLHGLVAGPAVSIDAARAAVHAVIARHEGLRSLIGAPGPDGTQQVYSITGIRDDGLAGTPAPALGREPAPR